MKYAIAVETMQIIEVDAETAEAAVEAVKSKLDPRVAAAAHYEIVQELTYDEESSTYKLP